MNFYFDFIKVKSQSFFIEKILTFESETKNRIHNTKQKTLRRIAIYDNKIVKNIELLKDLNESNIVFQMSIIKGRALLKTIFKLCNLKFFFKRG